MTKQTSAKSSLTDAERAPDEYRTYVENSYKILSLVADSVWRHDRRKKQSTTHEFDPEEEAATSDARRKKVQAYNAAGQEAGSFVEEDDEEDKRDDPEKSLSDCYKQYEDELYNSWRRKK